MTNFIFLCILLERPNEILADGFKKNLRPQQTITQFDRIKAERFCRYAAMT